MAIAPVTVVLRRCTACGEHATLTLSGAWELADLLRERSEIAELERMAR